MQKYNPRGYENTERFIKRQKAVDLLIRATKSAQIQVLRAHKGRVTSEFMNEQIGGRLARGYDVILVGYPPNENIQMVKRKKENGGADSSGNGAQTQ